MHNKRTVHTAFTRRRPQFVDQIRDASEEVFRDSDFRHLEGNITAVADDLCTDLDQLISQTGRRPVLDRLRRFQSAKGCRLPTDDSPPKMKHLPQASSKTECWRKRKEIEKEINYLNCPELFYLLDVMS
jgi:hypothetical protein